MADGESDRCLIGKSAKSKATYGTTTNSAYTNETYIKHVLKKSDTLQGVALKYGVAMEQIKRANNIWTNDSLFIRDYILIPYALSPREEKPPSLANGSIHHFSASLDSASLDSVPHGGVVSKQSVQQHNSRVSKSRSQDCLAPSTSSFQGTSPPAKDFLSKFDNSLDRIKSNLEKLEQTTKFPEDASNPLNLLPSRRNSKYGYRNQRGHLSDFESLDSDPAEEPKLVFKSNNPSRNKRVKSSMEKLEKEQEDMFQL